MKTRFAVYVITVFSITVLADDFTTDFEAGYTMLPGSGLAIWQIIEDPAVYGSLPVPPSVDPTLWNNPAWTGWARRAIHMIRPIYGPPYNTALWDGSNTATGYDLLSVDLDPGHVTLHWADGTPSGFSLLCMPTPGPEVRIGVVQGIV